MATSAGSLVRAAALAAGLTLGSVAAAWAQQPLASPPPTPQLMARYDFHLSAAALASDDQRFAWDTHWGGDFDLVDYVGGRLIFLVDYQAVLGDEFRPFDPHQGNYLLAVAGSARAGATEIAGVFHHVSRHLSDRPKRQSVAWNAVVGRVLRRFDIGEGSIDVRADVGKVVAIAFVDYTWLGVAEVTVRQPIAPHAAVYGRVFGETFGTDPSVADRGRQQGGRVEAGVRVSGTHGVIELFTGAAQVVDAFPLDRDPRRWVFAGFRLLNR